jgi:hypothetical protein
MIDNETLTITKKGMFIMFIILVILFKILNIVATNNYSECMENINNNNICKDILKI